MRARAKKCSHFNELLSIARVRPMKFLILLHCLNLELRFFTLHHTKVRKKNERQNQ